MMYREKEIRTIVASAEYYLPKREELVTKLQTRKLIPMQVAQQRYADFVTGNLDEFLRFLRAGNVRQVMFSYSYYTAAEIEEMFRLDDRDKALFRNYSYPDPKKRPLTRERNHWNTEQTDYAQYMRYAKCVQETLDLSHPKELRLYALVQGRVIACQLADAWILRLDLITRSRLRQIAMEDNLGAGCLPFGFYA